MAKTNPLVYVGAGVAAIYLYSRYKLYQGVQFGVAGFGIKTNPLRLNVRVSINNPTPVRARLDSIAGSIYQPQGTDPLGTYVAQVEYKTSTVIAPYNRTLISLDITPDILGTIEALLNYKRPFRFVGNAVIDGIPLPVDLEYSYDMLINS